MWLTSLENPDSESRKPIKRKGAAGPQEDPSIYLRLLRILDRHPEAKAAVIEALQRQEQ